VRFVELDEVHTYKGALGTDVACLVQRLRAALGEANPLFVGTSATLQSGAGDPRTGVAEFFTHLTGQPTAAESVIREQTAAPELPERPASCPGTADYRGGPWNLLPRCTEQVLALIRKLTGCAATSPETCWASTAMPYLLLNWLKDPLPLSGVVERLAARPERAGVAADALLREVQAAVLVGPCLERTHALCLRPRVHRFLRGLRCALCARAFSGTCCSAGFRSSGHKLASTAS
jgi:hypothetical protein